MILLFTTAVIIGLHFYKFLCFDYGKPCITIHVPHELAQRRPKTGDQAVPPNCHFMSLRNV